MSCCRSKLFLRILFLAGNILLRFGSGVTFGDGMGWDEMGWMDE